jgi:PEP-CTERM motif
MAVANSAATGGVGGAGGPSGATGAANATSTAQTAKGALAQALSTADGSSGKAQSTALTSFSFVKAQSAAVAQVGSTATTNAIAQGGGSGQAFVNPGQTAYAFSTALPDKAYSATLIDGAHDVAGALLGPRDVVFGAAVVGANYATDGGGESHT